jgi:transcriptional regulator with XRE-family HTH domain
VIDAPVQHTDAPVQHTRSAAPSRSDLGRAIRELRLARGLTIEDLAYAACIHPTTLSPIERGRRSPHWETLCFIADGLEIPVADVVRQAERVAGLGTSLKRVLDEERARLP